MPLRVGAALLVVATLGVVAYGTLRARQKAPAPSAPAPALPADEETQIPLPPLVGDDEVTRRIEEVHEPRPEPAPPGPATDEPTMPHVPRSGEAPEAPPPPPPPSPSPEDRQAALREALEQVEVTLFMADW